MYRCAIPLIAECPFVSRCLRALRAILPAQVGLQLLVKWYGARNAPGTKDLNSVQEWTMLCAVLMESVGRPVASSSQHPQQQQSTQSQQQTPHAKKHDNSNDDIAMDADNDDDEASFSSDAEPKKRRKSENCQGTDADWEYLLAYVERTSGGGQTAPTSRRTTTLPHYSDTATSLNRYNCNAPLFGKLPLIFYAMHLFYEEQKLFVLTSAFHMRSLGQLLYLLAVDLQLECYRMHYFLDQPQLIYLPTGSALSETETRLLSHQSLLCGTVPSIFKYLHGIVSDEPSSGRPQYPHMADVNNRSRDIVLVIFECISIRSIR